MSSELDFEAVAETFYKVLFREAPDVERLFHDDLNKTVMFVNALESISNMEHGDPYLTDFMESLGKRHRSIGVTQQHVEAGWTAFNAAILAGGKDLPPARSRFFKDAFRKLVKAMNYDPNGLL